MFIGKVLKKIFLHQLNTNIQIYCKKEHYGTEYGGWVVCPTIVNKDNIVYSCGVGEDISFDLELIAKFGCNVYAFDPTPKSIKWIRFQKLPKEFHFYEYGIADYDGTATFYPPKNPNYASYTIIPQKLGPQKNIVASVFRLKTIMKILKHTKIDILKIDIEGAEYAVIKDAIKSNIKIVTAI